MITAERINGHYSIKFSADQAGAGMMSNEYGNTIPAGAVPDVYLSADGDIEIAGIEEELVRVDQDQSDGVKIKASGNEVHLSTIGDLTVEVPHGTSLFVEHTGGDLDLSKITGKVVIDHVGGDADLSDHGEILIRKIGGDVESSRSRGNIQILRAGGDCEISDCSGFITVEKAGGDLTLETIGSGVVANCGGDADLTIRNPLQLDCSIHSGGDLTCAFIGAVDCTVHAMSGGDLTVYSANGKQEIESSHYSFQAGENGHTINLMAGGDMDIEAAKMTSPIHVDTGTKPNEPINPAAFKDWENQYTAGRIINIDIPDVGSEINKAQAQIEKAGNRIQTAVRKIFVEDKRATKTDTEIPPTSPVYTPAAVDISLNEEPVEPVSDEERLMILQMVQDKKITVEEAMRLLETLEQSAG
jgi:hypothetical protein